MADNQQHVPPPGGDPVAQAQHALDVAPGEIGGPPNPPEPLNVPVPVVPNQVALDGAAVGQPINGFEAEPVVHALAPLLQQPQVTHPLLKSLRGIPQIR